MRPKSEKRTPPARAPARDAAGDHRAKAVHEAARIARRLRDLGHPPPLGDPASGAMLVLEPPAGPRILDAIGRSLASVGLPDAYVTWSSSGVLGEEILAAEPSVLVAVGPRAAREIDALDHPLARRPFSDAAEGAWFAWTKGTAGLLLPALAPALDDEEAKKRFWRAFLALRGLAPADRP